MSHLMLEEFVPEQAILELRYPPAWIVFDRYGQIAEAMQRTFEGVTVQTVDANQLTLRAGQQAELTVGPRKSWMARHRPALSLHDFDGPASEISKVIIEALHIATLERVGFRFILAKKCADMESAAAAVMAGTMLATPDLPVFDCDRGPFTPEVAVRFESGARGVTVRLRSEHRRVSFEPPLSLPQVAVVDEEQDRVVLDVDFYTSKPIGAGQFDAKEWFTTSLHLLRRDIPRILGG